MPVPYRAPGLCLAEDTRNDEALVRALQRDLRALGYLAGGLDGSYGGGTAAAVRALQLDLIGEPGAPAAPGTIAAFNPADAGSRRAVAAVDGRVDEGLAGCIERMLADSGFSKLPESADPAGDNRRAVATIGALRSAIAPAPFIRAIVTQESGGRHFHEPARDDDRFITIGLDRNDPQRPERITSRGYGIGQYTLFHHPPQPAEVEQLILTPANNVRLTFSRLRDKFDHFLLGADGADDRKVEHPLLPLRLCRYPASDPRYLADCRQCALDVRARDISATTPLYAGAPATYHADQYYTAAAYPAVPDRAAFLCDWPYAVRRYNGGGVDSFHYQARVLLNLKNAPP